jgi:cytochrome d ubiquinol oxidase subunit II
MKTEGPLQTQARRQALALGAATLVCIVAVSLATPFLEQRYYARWFAWPNVVFAAQVPLLLVIASALFFVLLRRGHERAPFLIALGVFALCFAGLGISVYPDLVPGAVSIEAAAAPPASQGFVLVGAAVLIPVILGYTGWAYWVFRGKVGREGYH